MKHSQQCPKCGSGDILQSPDVPDKVTPNEAVAMHLGVILQRGRLSTSQKFMARIEGYVCLECGYIEFYTPDCGELRTWWKSRDIPRGALSRATPTPPTADDRSLSPGEE